MNTKIKGISLVFAVIGLALAGVASAALVNYLSNSVSNTAEVVSPIVMSVNTGRDGSESGDNSINMDTTGGSDFTFTTVAKNNANNTIKGYRVVVIEETDGGKLTGEEITKVMNEVAFSEGTVTDITPYLYVVKGDGALMSLVDYIAYAKTLTPEQHLAKLVMITSTDGGTTATKASLDAGEVDWNVFTMTLNPATKGTYVLSSEFTVDLTTYAASEYGI